MEPKPANPAPPKKPTPRLDILENILCVLTEEQALLFSQRLLICYERATERFCPQSISIELSERGHPRNFPLSDNVTPPKPGNYKAE